MINLRLLLAMVALGSLVTLLRLHGASSEIEISRQEFGKKRFQRVKNEDVVKREPDPEPGSGRHLVREPKEFSRAFGGFDCVTYKSPRDGRVWGNGVCAEYDDLLMLNKVYEAGLRFIDHAVLEEKGEEEACRLAREGPKMEDDEKPVVIHIVRPSGLHPDVITGKYRPVSLFGERDPPPVPPEDAEAEHWRELEAHWPVHQRTPYVGSTYPDIDEERFPLLRGYLRPGFKYAVGYSLCFTRGVKVRTSGMAMMANLHNTSLLHSTNYFRGPMYDRPYWNRYTKKGTQLYPCVGHGSPGTSGIVCQITEDPHLHANADIVTYYAGENARLPPRMSTRQLWVGHLWESASYRPRMASAEYLSQFNFTSIMSPRSTYPQLWTYRDVKVDLNVDKLFSRERAVLALYSNCKSNSNRERILADLVSLMPKEIDSYGKCNNNRGKLDDGPYSKGGTQTYRSRKEALQSKYKFELVIQNSVCYDFVDEKVYEALINGVIPIYVGAPNIARYVPKGSVIDWNDFDSEKHLANHIRAVAQNRELFERYHAWRRVGKVHLPLFADRVFAPGKADWICGACEASVMSNLFGTVHSGREPVGQCCDKGLVNGCEAMDADPALRHDRRRAFRPEKRRPDHTREKAPSRGNILRLKNRLLNN